MNKISCPSCGQKISFFAKRCPFCKEVTEVCNQNKELTLKNNDDINDKFSNDGDSCLADIDTSIEEQISGRISLNKYVFGTLVLISVSILVSGVIQNYFNLQKPPSCYDESVKETIIRIYRENRENPYYSNLSVENIQVNSYNPEIKKYECTGKIKYDYEYPQEYGGSSGSGSFGIEYSSTKRPDGQNDVFVSFPM